VIFVFFAVKILAFLPEHLSQKPVCAEF